ncbi:MAG: tetratricopeptide repeat protein, partial [Acidimicrobiia bacterium]|nr:tetratricopeptide repeat protein [Acidimicrobiia bacterium]
LWFSGDDHLLRGAAAAAAMRNELRVVGKQSTAAGRVALKMTVGVHTGDFDFFVVGESHEELIIAGPSATRTVATEESAVAGQVLVSPAVAAGLPARHLGDEKGIGRLLRGNPVADKVMLPDASGRNLEQHVPVGLRAAAGGEAGAGEHRPSTIAFVKYTGIDALLRDEGPDRLAEQFDGLIQIAQAACDQYEVTFLATDVDKDGGKIILTAGVPTASDADDERMLLAVRHIVEADPPIKVKIGVNRGRIFAADVGATFRRTYTIIGDDVNLAARVMTQAGYNEILATLPVLNASRTKFETTPIEPFNVKGKTEPVVAAAVGVATGVEAPGHDVSLPLFGHATELWSLLEGAEAVIAGAGTGFEITGPPGIGKSRLLDEVVAINQQLPWHNITCERYHRTTPYFAVARLLKSLLEIGPDTDDREMVGILSDAVAVHAPHLGKLTPLIAAVLDLSIPPTATTRAIDQKFVKDRTQDAVAELIGSVIASPTGIMVNNGELMDSLSAGVFDRLARRLEDLTLMLVNVRRPEDTGWVNEQLATLELAPIENDEARQLVNALRIDDPLAAHVVDQIVERGSGNPMFLIELALASGTDGGELPESVEATVSARLDRVPGDLRKLLRYGAAVGRAFNPRMLAEVVGDDVPAVHDPAAWKSLDAFLERERGTERLRFRQKIYRHVAYAGLPFRIRRILHDRIGRTIEEHAEDVADEAEILSMHFDLAGDAERTWKYSVTAAERARAKWANEAAAELYRRARKAGRDLDIAPSSVLEVAEFEGDLSELAALYDDARTAYAAARKLAGNDVLSNARLMHKQGVLDERAGRYPQALRWYSRALRAIEVVEASDQAAKLRVDLRVAYAGVRYRQARYRDCSRWSREAAEEAERLDLKSELAHAYYLMSHALDYLGNNDGVYEEKALEIYEELGDFVGQGNVLNNLGASAYSSGRWDEALGYHARSQAARQKAGDVVGVAIAEFNTGLILIDQGKVSEASGYFADAQRVFKAAGYLAGETAASVNLGIIATRESNFELADSLLGEGLRVYESLGAERFIQDTRLRIAELRLLEGASATALEMATEGEHAAGSVAGLNDLRAGFDRVVGIALAQLWRFDEAREHLRGVLDQARADGEQYEAILALQGLTLTDLWSQSDGDAQLSESELPESGLSQELAEEMLRLGIVQLPRLEVSAFAGRP